MADIRPYGSHPLPACPGREITQRHGGTEERPGVAGNDGAVLRRSSRAPLASLPLCASVPLRERWIRGEQDRIRKVRYDIEAEP